MVGCQCAPQRAAGPIQVGFFGFDTALRGETIRKPIVFTNLGDRPEKISGLAVSGSGFSVEGGPDLDVPANGQATAAVLFAPTAFGAHAGTLSFTPSDTGTPAELELHGNAVGPSLDVEPPAIDLGTIDLYPGQMPTASALLKVRNRGVDATPAREDTVLAATFQVASDPNGELCVGSCTGETLRVPVDGLTDVPVTLTAKTAGTKRWDVQVSSNDPFAQVRTVPVTANVVSRRLCELSFPQELDFGVVTSPERRELALVLKNVGAEPCEVQRVELGDENPNLSVFSIADAPAASRVVAPGEQLSVTVRAWPQGAPPASPLQVLGELRVQLNRPAPVLIALRATVGLSCLSISPSPLDFGTVQAGCRSAERAVAMRNVCAQSVTIDGLTLSTQSDFSVLGTVPQTLAPNAEATFTARYAPRAIGQARDAVVISWTDGARRQTTVPVLGEANATGRNVDLFPAQPNKLDILLVLDQSCSMQVTHLDHVTSELPSLLTALQARNVDFHLGVVNAQFVSGPQALRTTPRGAKWLTSSSPDLAQQFSALTALAPQSNIASCAIPAVRALSAPAIATVNAGFLRADAALTIICVSDFIDEGSMLSEVLQLKPPGRVVWDEIAELPTSTCVPAYPLARSDYARMTGGKTNDICTSGWRPWFDLVAARSAASRTFFPLRARPDPAAATPLAVSVSGASVPPVTTAGTPVWSWDPVPNAIVFQDIYGAAPSDTVSVSYSVACMP